MSLTAALRPPTLSFPANISNRLSSLTTQDNPQAALQNDSNYIALSRMLLRFQHIILLTPYPTSSANTDVSTAELTPLQRQIQAELWSPLPYHRTKWLHSIENARTLLLQLERTAQNIKVQRTKQEASKNLAAKRALIKTLRNRVEEIGREVESMGEEAWNLNTVPEGKETLRDILARKRPQQNLSNQEHVERSEHVEDGRLVSHVSEEDDGHEITKGGQQKDRDALFNSSSTIRHRAGQNAASQSKPDSTAETSGFSNLKSTERSLLDSSKEHEGLTASLVSMAVQLKQQARAFEFALDQDKGLLNRALEGLDRNISGMEVASKNMAFLRRMSEGEGWLGRMKLYAMIFGMWIVAIILVFVGPKLRF